MFDDDDGDGDDDDDDDDDDDIWQRLDFFLIQACLKLCQIREIITRCHCKPSTSSLDLGIDDLNVFDSCMDRDGEYHCELFNGLWSSKVSYTSLLPSIVWNTPDSA